MSDGSADLTGTDGAAVVARREVSVAAVAWIGISLLFVGLRLGVALNVPVAGVELAHLSGAWEASTGEAGPRFVPTLFQAVTAVSLQASDSQTPARLIALLAAATIPLALYLLRKPLGEAGALIALLLLAFDAPGMLLGATASALGFDIALSTWLAVILVRKLDLGLGWLAVGAFSGLCGPVALPLLAGRACTAPLAGRRDKSFRRRWRPLLLFLVGTVAAIAVASTRFGAGGGGLVVPPLDLFTSGFSADWLSGTVGDHVLLYGLPILVAGTVALGLRAWQWMERGTLPAHERLLVAWAGFALAWLVASLGSQSVVPLAAFGVPAALLAGPMLARLASASATADWRVARLALPAAAAFAGLIVAVVLDWATNERPGPLSEKFLVAAFVTAIALLLGMLLANRRSAALAAIPGVTVGALLLVSGAIPIAAGAATEPLISPVSTAQARILRNTAVGLREERGGAIVIHSDLRDEATWPFRDSGQLIYASRVPLGARVVVWPAPLPPPEGFDVLVGNWALTRDAPAPASSLLRALHWYIDRHTLAITPRPVAVYTKASE